MSKEFFDAVKAIEAEKGIPAEYLYEKISAAIIVAAKHDYNGKDIVHCDIDPEKQKIKVYVRKNVVDEIEDEDTDLTLEQAQLIRKSAKVGGTVDIPLKTKNFGRIVAQTAKHVIRQGIREAERGQMIEEFKSKNQELITAKVDRIDPDTGNVTLDMGKNSAVLPKTEQVPGEHFTVGENIKVFVVDVKEMGKGPRIMISRTHPGMVRRLFEQEVPEIYDGTIEIKSVSREAGSRTKIAVYSTDEDVDPVGACIGPRGQRVQISLMYSAVRKSISLSITTTRHSMFLRHLLRQRFAVWKFLMRTLRVAVQPFLMTNFLLLSAIRVRMFVLQQGLRVGKSISSLNRDFLPMKSLKPKNNYLAF